MSTNRYNWAAEAQMRNLVPNKTEPYQTTEQDTLNNFQVASGATKRIGTSGHAHELSHVLGTIRSGIAFMEQLNANGMRVATAGADPKDLTRLGSVNSGDERDLAVRAALSFTMLNPGFSSLYVSMRAAEDAIVQNRADLAIDVVSYAYLNARGIVDSVKKDKIKPSNPFENKINVSSVQSYDATAEDAITAAASAGQATTKLTQAQIKAAADEVFSTLMAEAFPTTAVGDALTSAAGVAATAGTALAARYGSRKLSESATRNYILQKTGITDLARGVSNFGQDINRGAKAASALMRISQDILNSNAADVTDDAIKATIQFVQELQNESWNTSAAMMNIKHAMPQAYNAILQRRAAFLGAYKDLIDKVVGQAAGQADDLAKVDAAKKLFAALINDGKTLVGATAAYADDIALQGGRLAAAAKPFSGSFTKAALHKAGSFALTVLQRAQTAMFVGQLLANANANYVRNTTTNPKVKEIYSEYNWGGGFLPKLLTGGISRGEIAEGVNEIGAFISRRTTKDGVAVYAAQPTPNGTGLSYVPVNTLAPGRYSDPEFMGKNLAGDRQVIPFISAIRGAVGMKYISKAAQTMGTIDFLVRLADQGQNNASTVVSRMGNITETILEQQGKRGDSVAARQIVSGMFRGGLSLFTGMLANNTTGSAAFKQSVVQNMLRGLTKEQADAAAAEAQAKDEAKRNAVVNNKTVKQFLDSVSSSLKVDQKALSDYVVTKLSSGISAGEPSINLVKAAVSEAVKNHLHNQLSQTKAGGVPFSSTGLGRALIRFVSDFDITDDKQSDINVVLSAKANLANAVLSKIEAGDHSGARAIFREAAGPAALTDFRENFDKFLAEKKYKGQDNADLEQDDPAPVLTPQEKDDLKTFVANVSHVIGPSIRRTVEVVNPVTEKVQGTNVVYKMTGPREETMKLTKNELLSLQQAARNVMAKIPEYQRNGFLTQVPQAVYNNARGALDSNFNATGYLREIEVNAPATAEKMIGSLVLEDVGGVKQIRTRK